MGFGHFGDQGGILGCSPPPCAIANPIAALAALEGMRQHPEVLGGVTPSLLPPHINVQAPGVSPAGGGHCHCPKLGTPRAGGTKVWGHALTPLLGSSPCPPRRAVSRGGRLGRCP